VGAGVDVERRVGEGLSFAGEVPPEVRVGRCPAAGPEVGGDDDGLLSGAVRDELVGADILRDTGAGGLMVRPGKSGGRYICELLVSLSDPSAA
jgi:hypothetical protein